MRVLIICLGVGLCTPLDAALSPLKSTPVERAIRRAALKHALDPDLLLALYRVESGLRLGAINKQTQDYGLAQINKHTLRAYKLDKARLLTDLDYSAAAGARVLADFKAQYSKREPQTWVCRYNLGGKPLIGRRAELCLTYLNKLTRPQGARNIAGGFR